VRKRAYQGRRRVGKKIKRSIQPVMSSDASKVTAEATPIAPPVESRYTPSPEWVKRMAQIRLLNRDAPPLPVWLPGEYRTEIDKKE
jgi:hypothetical protein